MLIIEVKKGNIEGALKQFKSKIIKTKLVPQLQERKTYKKNTITHPCCKRKPSAVFLIP